MIKFIAPQVMLTCKMLNNTPGNMTGHVDLLFLGEMSMHDI